MSIKRRFHIEEGILILLLTLSLIGTAVTDHALTDGFGYWLIMVVVFALFSIILGWLQSKHRDGDFQVIFREQFIHWSTSFLVIIGAFLVQKSDHIDSDSAALVILLILSLSTMLDGLRVGWRFSAIGLFLGISAVVAAHVKHFMWIEFTIAAIIVSIIILVDIWSAKRSGS
jgi:hypothetical protein